jgi:hypothetical protein
MSRSAKCVKQQPSVFISKVPSLRHCVSNKHALYREFSCEKLPMFEKHRDRSSAASQLIVQANCKEPEGRSSVYHYVRIYEFTR